MRTVKAGIPRCSKRREGGLSLKTEIGDLTREKQRVCFTGGGFWGLGLAEKIIQSYLDLTPVIFIRRNYIFDKPCP